MVVLEHYSNQNAGVDNVTVDYMKAVTLRGIRYLPEITKEQWDMLVKEATSSAKISSLMATETWLALNNRYKNMITESHIDAVKMALKREPPPISRVIKNYWLIIKQNRVVPF